MAEKNEKQVSDSLEDIIKADIEERKRLHKTAMQYQKHIRILKYIDELEVFTTNKIFHVMIDNKEQITRKTITHYLDTLYNEGYLDLEVIKTRFPRPALLYSLKDIDPEKLQRAIDKLILVNLEEEQKDKKPLREGTSYKSSMNQTEQYDQARIDKAKTKEQLPTPKLDEYMKEKQQEAESLEETYKKHPELRHMKGSIADEKAKKERKKKQKKTEEDK